MRRASMWLLAALVAMSGVAIGAQPAVAEAGACTDPVDDTFLDEDPDTKAAGALDIVEMEHANESDKVDYRMTTDAEYDTADIGEFNWFIDADQSGSDAADFEGRVWVRPRDGNLRGVVIDMTPASATAIATATVVHEDASKEVTVEFDQDALTELGVEDAYDYYVETIEADGYRKDFTEACEHVLTSEAGSEPTETSVALDDTTITQGGTISGSAGGFDPDSNADVTVFSNAVSLGTVQADEDGVASFSFQLPTSVTPGSHRIEIRGVNPDGAVHVASANFTVVAAQVASPAPTTAPQSTSLPTTGAGVGGLVQGSVLLLASGSALLTATRLRRVTEPVRAPSDGIYWIPIVSSPHREESTRAPVARADVWPKPPRSWARES